MKGKKWTLDDVEKMFVNPFYAITLDPVMCVEHTPLVTKEEWIQANVNLMKEIGPERWLNQLLEAIEVQT